MTKWYELDLWSQIFKSFGKTTYIVFQKHRPEEAGAIASFTIHLLN